MNSNFRFQMLPWLAIVILVHGVDAVRAEPVPSFQNDVLPAISKAGCNLGTCHGNARGKGGFQLSLRGQDPAEDFQVLTHDWLSRRANRLQPDESLYLRKATMELAHEGGRRFQTDSPLYRILRDWIAAGMPNDSATTPKLESLTVTPPQQILVQPAKSLQLNVVAKFSDGTARDVSWLACYEAAVPSVEFSNDGMVTAKSNGETTVLVRYQNQQVAVRLAFIEGNLRFEWNPPRAANFIDDHIFAKLKSLQRNPAALCDDTTFVRRVYLDLTGLLPTGEQAKAFVHSTDSEKRGKLIDELLERPEFADHWALKWADLLRNEEKTLDRKGVEVFHGWMRESIAKNKPLDQFVKELIASRGSTYTVPPANFYRALRDPIERAESVAQLFLGVRLQCAKCHNHPFDRWTQDDYYGWANLFSRIEYKIVENKRKDKNDAHEFDGEQIVIMAEKGDVNDPRTGKPRSPKFLAPQVMAIENPELDRLQALADWLTDSQNERFTQMLANRIWQALLGRGIVDPIDDFRATNPPSHPELLGALAEHLRQHHYDAKDLIRTIMRSSTYQLSSLSTDANQEDDSNFSRGIVRRLTAEQLLDSVANLTKSPIEFQGHPVGLRANQLPGVRVGRAREEQATSPERFLRQFGKPQRLQSCECERSAETTLNQTFLLVSGPLINQMLTRGDNRLDQMTKSSEAANLKAQVTLLYWDALGRDPSSAELTVAENLLQQAANRRTAWEDIVWSLINSNEFLLRR